MISCSRFSNLGFLWMYKSKKHSEIIFVIWLWVPRFLGFHKGVRKMKNRMCRVVTMHYCLLDIAAGMTIWKFCRSQYCDTSQSIIYHTPTAHRRKLIKSFSWFGKWLRRKNIMCTVFDITTDVPRSSHETKVKSHEPVVCLNDEGKPTLTVRKFHYP